MGSVNELLKAYVSRIVWTFADRHSKMLLGDSQLVCLLGKLLECMGHIYDDLDGLVTRST